MSESDSFITEVSEEVRRDRLFKTFKKYSWVLVLIVVGIVGGTAYNEWNKGAQTEVAQLTGDVMRAAIDAGNVDPLVKIAAENSPAAVIALFQQSTLLADAGDNDGAVAALTQITDNADLSDVYTDLAWLKIIMLNGANMPADERDDIIESLSQETDPYRLLGIEQRALQFIRDGDIDAALNDLAQILADEIVSQGLRNRAQQLTISLGGVLEATSNG